MKNKAKHRGNKTNKRIKIRQCTSYEPDFKKAVVLYAEQKSTSEAKRRYGISESNIRRWRRLKNDILEKASQTKSTRKSTRTLNTFEGSLEECDSLDFSSSLDSMPLEQRLKAPEQEPILQSQPLSPTKLKVTRQSTKPSHPSPKPATPEPPNEEVCLRWNSHHSNMQSSFPNLLMREQYVDATLVAEGQSLKCHRLILSSCSPYFEEVLSGISPFQHPVLFMKDIPFWVLKSLCDFMYAGEVHIFQNKLEELLAVAESLKIKGLAGKMDGSNEDVKPAEPAKPAKEEKKEEKEVKEKKRNSQQAEPTPKASSKAVRSTHPSKKSEKVSKEPLNKEGILDPLDLLEPVYEEVTKETAPPKVKEIKSIPLKKGKLKKRKFSEEREESPPPLFLSRKGTRSRPNVKIPKYYHTHYERVSESTIVREPHTHQRDPLLPLEEIKAEPLDMEDDVIEIEDNVIEFSDVPEIPPHDEEIIGNYDSPLVNPNKATKEEESSSFKKINIVAQPIIMNVHSIAEKAPSTLQIVDVAQLKETARGLNEHSIAEKPASTLEIVDVAQLKETVEVLDKSDDPLEVVSDLQDGKTAEDPLNFVDEDLEKGADSITITNVQSMADVEETEEKLQDKSVEDAEKKRHVESEEAEMVLDEIDHEGHVESVVNEAETAAVVEKLPEAVKTPKIDTTVLGELEISVNNEKEPESITITNVQSIADVEEIEEKLQDKVVENAEEKQHVENEEGEAALDDINREIHVESVMNEPETASVVEEPSETVETPNIDTTEPTEPEISTNNEKETKNVPSPETPQDNFATDEGEPEKPCNETVTIEGEDEPTQAEPEIEKLVNNGEADSEENAVEPGFHIAKVASEQFSIFEAATKDIVSEDRASELGFQITNVVSGQIEDSSDQAAPLDSALNDLGTFSNHLEQTEAEAPEQRDDPTDIKSVGNSLSEETQFLAESLEKLLDK